MNDTYGETILRPHRRLEKTVKGQQVYALNFTDSEFSDIIFSYGKVEFKETGEELVLKFDYEVHEFKKEYDKKKFEKELGDFLLELVADGVIKNNLIYSGGTDEDRENNYSSTDNE